jgi:hypothetical protein
MGTPDTAFYELHFPRLVGIATSELHLAESEAITLVHEVLLSAVFRLTTTDIEAWLDGALRSAAQRLAEVRS